MDQMIERASQSKCSPKELRELVRAETGVRLRITFIKRIMRGYGLPARSRRKYTSTRPTERRSGTGSTALISGFRTWRRKNSP